MLVKFETKAYHQITNKDISYSYVWLNPNYVVSVREPSGERYAGHTEVTTCAREEEEANESYLLKGKAEDIVKSMSLGDHSG